jgi:hypothetical protein
MRIGPRLEATRHLLGEPALTLARQSRHHFPKQGRGTTTDLGCRRSKTLLAVSSKPTEFLIGRHKQSICRLRRSRVQAPSTVAGASLATVVAGLVGSFAFAAEVRLRCIVSRCATRLASTASVDPSGACGEREVRELRA